LHDVPPLAPTAMMASGLWHMKLPTDSEIQCGRICKVSRKSRLKDVLGENTHNARSIIRSRSYDRHPTPGSEICHHSVSRTHIFMGLKACSLMPKSLSVVDHLRLRLHRPSNPNPALRGFPLEEGLAPTGRVQLERRMSI
jgi:hypothetical protein